MVIWYRLGGIMTRSTYLTCTQRSNNACKNCKCYYCSKFVCISKPTQCHYEPLRTRDKKITAKNEPLDPNNMVLDLTNVSIPFDNMDEGPDMYNNIDNNFKDGITSEHQIVYTNVK
jgi:hypothetical protein